MPDKNKVEENPAYMELAKLLGARQDSQKKLVEDWLKLKEYVAPFIAASGDDKLKGICSTLDMGLIALSVDDLVLLMHIQAVLLFQQMLADPLREMVSKMSPQELAEMLSVKEQIDKQMGEKNAKM